MMVTLAGSSGALSGLLGIIIIDGHGALHEPIDRKRLKRQSVPILNAGILPSRARR
jgi:hypothetical protein